MFKTRLLSGILLVVIALVTVITGGNVLFATLFLISMIGVYELYRVFEIQNKAVGICGFLFAAGYYGLLYAKPLLPDATDWFMLLFMAFVICLMAVLVFAYPRYRTEQILAAFFGVFYVAVMLSYIYQTRILPGGVFQVWLVFICAWGCDTCAYCVGMLIGKHKMAPKLSPKKSVEGGIGGNRGSSADRSSLCTCNQPLGQCRSQCGQLCNDWRSRRCDFPDRRSGSIRDQEKS